MWIYNISFTLTLNELRSTKNICCFACLREMTMVLVRNVYRYSNLYRKNPDKRMLPDEHCLDLYIRTSMYLYGLTYEREKKKHMFCLSVHGSYLNLPLDSIFHPTSTWTNFGKTLKLRTYVQMKDHMFYLWEFLLGY